MSVISNNRLKGSFRDPDSFVFTHKNEIYRQINPSCAQDFDLFISSGLYKKLVKNKLVIEHKEVAKKFSPDKKAYKVLLQEKIPFISYPYEWTFEQLKDAALLTLTIQKMALSHGITLKDASSYNVQFKGPNAIFIDTGSFAKYEEGEPWVAYRQFCQHFLAPLALAGYSSQELIQLSRLYIDGISLSLASKLLPKRSLLKPGLLTHLHIHARTQKAYENKRDVKAKKMPKISKQQLMALIQSLEDTIKAIPKPQGSTTWENYYNETNYTATSMREKKSVIRKWTKDKGFDLVWDMGGNDGTFSRVTAKKAKYVVTMDNDMEAIRASQNQNKEKGLNNILTLYMDLTNPSPSLGWEHTERDSLLDRGPADLVLALALVHHLAIGNNLPLSKIAEFFSVSAKNVIVEFIPKEDSQVQKLLATREDVFPNYTKKSFEDIFSERFKFIAKYDIKGSVRTLYFLERL